jgi:DUF1680 family protein
LGEGRACRRRRPIALTATNGYATIHRVWRKGDAVTLNLKMPAERLYAHPNVRMDTGRAALRRGPLIYWVEEADNPGGSVQALSLPRSARLDVAWRADLFGGAMTLKASAKRLVPGNESGALYSPEPPAARDVALVALPYHLWANRKPGSMQVWVPRASELASDSGTHGPRAFWFMALLCAAALPIAFAMRGIPINASESKPIQPAA